MVLLSMCTLIAFKHPLDRSDRPGSGSRVVARSRAREPEVEKYILCSSCHTVLTHPDEGITVQGAHEHTFANPHGVVFQIGCFQTATGCSYMGSPTQEFTWFKGFRWRVALCGNCLINVGWLFTSPAGVRFHGLILERLIFPGG